MRANFLLRALLVGASISLVSACEAKNPLATDDRIETIPPSASFANPDGALLAYVTHDRISPGRVTVINTATNSVLGTIWLNHQRARGIALAPAHGYVGHTDRRPVEVLDTEANTLETEVWCPDVTPPNNAGAPVGVAVSPDGAYVYAACSWGEDPGGPGFVMIVETATHTILETVTVGRDPFDLAVKPDGSEAYVSNYSSGSVSVIDLDSWQVVHTVGGIPCPRGIAFSPSGDFAWVTSECAGRVSAIDASTRMVTTVVGGMSNPHDVATTHAWPRPSDPPPGPGEDVRVYVTGNTGVWEIYASTVPPTVNFIPLAGPLGRVAITPDGSAAYVGHYRSAGLVSVIDVQTNAVVATIPVPGYAEGLAITPAEPGGFVTGGGWIWSDPGAHEGMPAAEGKASFGFTSKYKKDDWLPTGSTEFQFHAGDLNFHSSSYVWLFVSPDQSNAQFKGSGTVNGGLAPNGSEYWFTLWVGDDDPDTLRMKIWWVHDGITEIVYDNGVEQELGGGSIVIHDK